MSHQKHVLLEFIQEYGIRNLFPGYFALVMATGIISIAAHLQEMQYIAFVLFYFNCAAYLWLWLLLATRILRHFGRFKKDLTSHIKGPGFFTIIAGTNILGSQFFILTDLASLATILWFIGTILWVLIIYTFFTAITIKEMNPGLESGINGTWLISIVATQSVAILGTFIAGTMQQYQEAMFFGMTVIYLIGCMLYLLVITLIFYRFSFFQLKPEDLRAPYWINMGAVAITTLAGATLLLHMNQSFFLDDIQIFIKGFTLFFWSIGTWWIPLLLILGFWRHYLKKIPLPWTPNGYEPAYWGMVFPLGMYTACTWRLAQVLELEFLYIIPEYFIYAAFAGWLVSITGLLRMLINQLTRDKRLVQPAIE